MGNYGHRGDCQVEQDHPCTCGMSEEANMTDSKARSEQPDGGGLRYDDGKNKLDLIPIEWIWGLGQVLTQGAEKYAERNWERGMKWSKMVGCGLRHVFKFCVGERYDPESGCHHLLHAAWNFLSLFTYDVRMIGENDLPNWEDAAALAFIERALDPNHPRTQRLKALASERIQKAHGK